MHHKVLSTHFVGRSDQFAEGDDVSFALMLESETELHYGDPGGRLCLLAQFGTASQTEMPDLASLDRFLRAHGSSLGTQNLLANHCDLLRSIVAWKAHLRLVDDLAAHTNLYETSPKGIDVPKAVGDSIEFWATSGMRHFRGTLLLTSLTMQFEPVDE